MKHIISVFVTMFSFILHLFLCIAVSNVSGAITEAKELKADVIAEIENSNFNPNVIDACIRQAKDAGYFMQVTNCIYDERQKIQTAEVIVSYQYEIPFLGIYETMTTRGIAR